MSYRERFPQRSHERLHFGDVVELLQRLLRVLRMKGVLGMLRMLGVRRVLRMLGVRGRLQTDGGGIHL